jgi:hypothetical protein
VSVQLENGSQERVYLPAGSTLPLPGEKLALVDISVGKAGKKWVGVHYAPHIAVMRGI